MNFPERPSHARLSERKSLHVTVPSTDFLTLYPEPGAQPIYRLAFKVHIYNSGRGAVTLLARKWASVDEEANLNIVEAERVFNGTPRIPKHGVFSYGGVYDFPLRPFAIELRIAAVDEQGVPFISTPYVFNREQLTPTPDPLALD